MALPQHGDPLSEASLPGHGGQAEIAYRGLRELVRQGSLAPGEVFTEGALATHLGIGRTPCREAVSRLAHEGLLERLPKRGVLVKALRADDVRDLYAVRRALEVLCVEQVIEKIDERGVQAFREVLAAARDAVEEGVSWRGYRTHDLRFHDLIWTYSGNGRARDMLRSLHDAVILDPLFERYADMPNQQHVSLSEHARIVDALARRDPNGAVDAVRDHCDSYTRDLVAQVFKGHS